MNVTLEVIIVRRAIGYVADIRETYAEAEAALQSYSDAACEAVWYGLTEEDEPNWNPADATRDWGTRDEDNREAKRILSLIRPVEVYV